MSIQFEQVVLYSRQKDLLTQQLVDLFDSELVIAGAGLRLNQNGPTFAIVDDDGAKSVNNESLMFDYRVESIEELKALLQKVEFFTYRHSDYFKNFKPIKIQEIGNFQYFVFTDVDGRKWKFSTGTR